MVENNVTYYLENDLLYDVSNIAVLSNEKTVINVPDLQNNAIVVTREQLESLGIYLENNYSDEPVFEVDDSNLILSSNKNSPKKPVTQISKTRSVLINKFPQNETVVDENVVSYVSINVPQCDIPMYSPVSPKKAYFKPPSPEINPVEAPNKVIYRILHPEELRLTDKKQLLSQFETTQNLAKVKVKPVFKPKEPVEVEKKIFKDDVEKPEIDEDILTLKSVRTRFGRLTKPPQHLKKDHTTLEKNEINDEPPKKQMRTVSSTVKLQNQDDRLHGTSDMPKTEPVTTIQMVEHKVPKRKISSTKFRCKTCLKFYLGKTRMQRHLQLNPDHKVPKIFEPSNQLWMDLLERTSKVPKSDQTATFLGELSNILQKVRNVVPEALKPVMVENSSSCQIDSFLSSLLGIPEGKYTLDATVLSEEKLVFNEEKLVLSEEKVENQDIIDNSDKVDSNLESISNIDSASDNGAQTSLLNLLDTGQVNFDATDSAHTSEAVMCVDQLVQERLKTLTGVELPSASPNSNSVQNITLDLSMDLFSYHTS